MKTELVQIAAFAVMLVFCAAVQGFLPAWGGVKPPLLVALATYATLTRPPSRAIPCAFLAGALCDGLGALPFGCLALLLPPICLGVRMISRHLQTKSVGVAAGIRAVALAAMAGEACLGAWGVYGNSPARLPIAAFAGAWTGALLFALLPRFERFAGLEVPVT